MLPQLALHSDLASCTYELNLRHVSPCMSTIYHLIDKLLFVVFFWGRQGQTTFSRQARRRACTTSPRPSPGISSYPGSPGGTPQAVGANAGYAARLRRDRRFGWLIPGPRGSSAEGKSRRSVVFSSAGLQGQGSYRGKLSSTEGYLLMPCACSSGEDSHQTTLATKPRSRSKPSRGIWSSPNRTLVAAFCRAGDAVQGGCESHREPR